ncbi:Maf family protein [Thermosipho atlanticus]|uniref:dTTP/UTP pyrophosphatase n=1 Tax=Thermosipho atlanticus DSM 15807 TaxID=1123380 RepID=A0A1M5RWY6_9BACT|nr:Maf family protein [Thermosipho atlanticus]SHH30766.1 septum formation protein [Thermosipho atlanticus DSM 15807]
MKIILASNSPRRIELLKKLQLQFKIQPPNIDEEINEKDPIKHVLTLSKLKAENVFKDFNSIVIGADTIVFHKEIFGKPKDYLDAYNMLKSLSGTWHEVFTGVTILLKNESISFFERTKVKFKKLSDELIKYYLSTGEPFDKAGAYAIQGLGSILIEKIDGDFYNVMGLPISKLWDVLWNRGIISETKRKNFKQRS